MIAWLTAGVAAFAGMVTMGILRAATAPSGHGYHTEELLIGASPYLGFGLLAFAWRRSRPASLFFLGITTLSAGIAIWADYALLRSSIEANRQGLNPPNLDLEGMLPIVLAFFQWSAIAIILAICFVIRMLHPGNKIRSGPGGKPDEPGRVDWGEED